MTAWFAWQVRRDARADGARALARGHCAPHLVHSGAMLYMLLALPTPAGAPGTGGMAGMAPKHPTLAFVFALVLAGYSVWDLDRLSGGRYGLASADLPPATGITASAGVTAASGEVPGERTDGGQGLRALLLSTGTTVNCRVVMGVTMAFMLVVML